MTRSRIMRLFASRRQQLAPPAVPWRFMLCQMRQRPSPLPSAILVVAAIVATGCASRRISVQDYGIPACPPSAELSLFSPNALQCWFTAPHGRWRTLDHQSHLEALVVFVEARDVRDAETITRRLVADEGARPYSEILAYVRPEMPDVTSRVRRVRWTRGGTFETMDF